METQDANYWSRKLSTMLDEVGAVRIGDDPDLGLVADATEPIRRAMLECDQPAADLVATEPTYDTQALGANFEVLGFMAPFVVVRRRSDGVKGTLEFTHLPRVYFGWKQDD